MNSTIIIFANPEEDGGRIVRIQDRPVDQIPENSFIKVSVGELRSIVFLSYHDHNPVSC